ncbi:aldo/keto reductase [bacterium]|jgi:aryl-alcohol dehydrogenase-like predicted oxidoreductase|nr:aldo/keto reductase [bacterium]
MIDKIALGTVQFGVDYGINNAGGQIHIDEARKILNLARESSIDMLDTAYEYGNSEQVLGKIGVDKCQIITKTSSLENGIEQVINDFYQSLERLKINKVAGLLVHDFHDIQHPQFNDLFKQLKDLKQQGIIQKIGFSTYAPNQVDFLLDNFDFDLVQLPFNVFDNRLVQGGQLKNLKESGVEIHARSIFLQGVLLNFNNLSNYFIAWKGQFMEYQTMAKEDGLSLLEYALNFALNTTEIDKVLVGVDNEKQLREIIQSVKSSSDLSPYPINEVELLDPREWKV